MAKAKSSKHGARKQRHAVKSPRQREALETLEEVKARVPKGTKISERLVDLIATELESDMTLHEAKLLIHFGQIAWNLAVEPEIAREQLERLSGPQEARAAAYQIIARLKERKLALFPNDRRLVVATDAQEQRPGQFYFTAGALGNEDGSGRPPRVR